MKKAVAVLVLLVVVALAVIPAQASVPAKAPQACEAAVVVGEKGSIVQPMSYPFWCQKCTTCVNPIAFYRYTVCWGGYFDGCGGGYPSCRRPYHIVVGRSCNCQ